MAASTKIVVQAEDRASSVFRQVAGDAESLVSKLESMGTRAQKALGFLGLGVGAFKIGGEVKEAVLAAGRYETLGVAMEQVGKNAGYSREQLDGYALALQKTGIAMTESRQLITRLASAQVDLSKSTELARVAQDAAVIGGINSTEAFERLVHGIQSANVLVLRNIGISVDFEAAYAKMAASLGKTSKELTSQEKVQARVNAVMEEGERIAGTYASSMDSAYKKMTSIPRYLSDIQVLAGKLGEGVFENFISGAYDAAKAARDWLHSMEESGELAEHSRTLGEAVNFAADGFKTAAVALGAYHIATSRAAESVVSFFSALKNGNNETVNSIRLAMNSAKSRLELAAATEAEARAAYNSAFARSAYNADTTKTMALTRALRATELELAAATRARAVAQAEAAASSRALAGAQALAAKAGRGLQTAINALGGPWVLGITAGAAALGVLASAQSAAEKVTKDMAFALKGISDDMRGTAQEAGILTANIKGLSELDARIKALNLTTSIKDLEHEIANTRIGILSFASDAEKFAGSAIYGLAMHVQAGTMSLEDFKNEAISIAGRVQSSKVNEYIEDMAGKLAKIDQSKGIFSNLTQYISSLVGPTKESAKAAAELGESLKNVGSTEGDIAKLSSVFDRMTLSMKDLNAKTLARELTEYRQAVDSLAASGKHAEASIASMNLSMLSDAARAGGFGSLEEMVRFRTEVSEKIQRLEMGDAEFQKWAAEQKHAALTAALEAQSNSLAAEAQVLNARIAMAREATAEELEIWRARAAAIGESLSGIDKLLEGLKGRKPLEVFGGGRSGIKGAETAISSLTSKVEALKAQLAENKGQGFLVGLEKELAGYERNLGKASEATKAKAKELAAEAREIGRQIVAEQNLDVQNEFWVQYQQMTGLGLEQATQAHERALQKQIELYRNAGVEIADIEKWAQAKRLEYATDFVSGAIRGLKNYAKEARDEAKNAEGFVTSSFSGMEDALASFVTKGKVGVRSLADSVIADLARIAIRQSITGPLASALGGLFGGGGGSHFASGMGGVGSNLFAAGAAAVHHSGGVVGRDAAPTRTLPAWLFADAPRYHNGGYIGADERLAVLQTGERVLSRSQNAAYERGRATPIVNVNIHTPPGMKAETEKRPNASGGFDMTVFIEQVDNAMAAGIASGRSKTAQAIGKMGRMS